MCVHIQLMMGTGWELSFDQGGEGGSSQPMTNDHSRPTQFPFDNSNPMEDQSKGLAMKPSIKERTVNSMFYLC